MQISLKDIYAQFFWIGVQLLGGGYVIVPLLKQSIVEKKQWITVEELSDYYAMSQAIPGIVAANISTFIGYKLRGKRGAFVAISGIITSPIISILIIATIINLLLNTPFIKEIFWGVGIATIIIVFLSLKEIWNHSVNNLISWIIFVFAVTSSFLFKLSPVYIILISVLIGFIGYSIRRKN